MCTKGSNTLWIVTLKYVGTKGVIGLYHITKRRPNSPILVLIPSSISLPFHTATPQNSVGLRWYTDPAWTLPTAVFYVHDLCYCGDEHMRTNPPLFWNCCIFLESVLSLEGMDFPLPSTNHSEFFPHIYFNETLLRGLNYMNSNTSFYSTYTDSCNSRQH